MCSIDSEHPVPNRVTGILVNVQVARHGEPGPNDAGYAKRLADSTARSILRLERSPGMLAIAFDKAVMSAQAHCAVDPRPLRWRPGKRP